MSAAPGWRPEELVYCSNVHPGDDLDTVIQGLTRFIAPVGRARGLSRCGTGLWLSHAVATTLATQPAERQRFRTALDQAGVSLFTLNGFPYGDFHARAVKAAVYRPDWSEPERGIYTLQLAEILAECLPEDQAEGTISTLPLGFAPDWNDERREAALRQLCETARALAQLRERSGRSIRVCLEMEPGCVLESTDQLLALFTEALPAAADRDGIPRGHLQQHLGICYDVCHQAVMFEDICASLHRLQDAGIILGKIQVSSALEATHPASDEVRAHLNAFAEPRYLHQVRSRDPMGFLQAAMDLPEALEDAAFSREPWRVHFHVPIQTDSLFTGALGTTRHAIGEVLDFLHAHRGEIRPHLEVETYTWQVLPEALRPRDDAQLIHGLAAELQWLQEELRRRELLLP